MIFPALDNGLGEGAGKDGNAAVRVDVITLFPAMVETLLRFGVTGRDQIPAPGIRGKPAIRGRQRHALRTQTFP